MVNDQIPGLGTQEDVVGTNKIWRGLSLAAAGIVAALALQGCGRPASNEAQTVIGQD